MCLICTDVVLNMHTGVHTTLEIYLKACTPSRRRHLHLYVHICIFTASSFSSSSPHPAGNVARDLAAADPRLRHAVPGDGRPLPVRIRRRREGPAGVSGTPEFCGEFRQHLRNLDRKASGM